MIKLDKRIWTPDETCTPIHLEMSGGLSRRLIDFTVKPTTIVVLTSLCALQFVSPAGTKDIVRIGIGKSVSQSGLDEGLVSLNGFLANVIERGNALPNGSVSGFICNLSSGITIESLTPRPIRVILEPGGYFVQQIGSEIPGAMLVALSGYGFYDSPNYA